MFLEFEKKIRRISYLSIDKMKIKFFHFSWLINNFQLVNQPKTANFRFIVFLKVKIFVLNVHVSLIIVMVFKISRTMLILFDIILYYCITLKCIFLQRSIDLIFN